MPDDDDFLLLEKDRIFEKCFNLIQRTFHIFKNPMGRAKQGLI